LFKRGREGKMNGLQAEGYGYRHSNEGRHMSFIAVVRIAEISRYASEMEEPDFGSPMASPQGNEHHASR
jgi:hypothetical protein